jgi:CRP-like cAMP-binding protein
VILRRDQKVKVISRIPLFSGCSGAELARIASITVQADLPTGELLTREGERGEEFFVLVKGTAEVRKGKRQIDSLKAGDFVGEMALLTDAPRMATVRATSPVTVLRASRRGFSELLDTSPGIQRKVRKALADRLAPTAL